MIVIAWAYVSMDGTESIFRLSALLGCGVLLPDVKVVVRGYGTLVRHHVGCRGAQLGPHGRS